MDKPLYITFTGTASVGKTTLIKPLIPLLKEMYSEPVTYIAEVARSLEKRGFKINKEATSETQRMIEDEYLRLEREATGQIKVADRSIIDRFAYALMNDGSKADKEKIDLLKWYDSSFKEHCSKYSHIFYIPLTENLKLELDGVRSPDEDYRRKIDELQSRLISMYNIKVYTLEGTVEERLNTIKKTLEKTHHGLSV